jgi:hypothetical protein
MTTLTDSARIEFPSKAPYVPRRRPGEQVSVVTRRPRALGGTNVGRQSSRIWRHLRAPDGARY